jgi:polyisoprenoid-binding protein YceI
MKNRIGILLLLSIIMGLAAACAVLRQPEAASGPIEAVPVESDSEQALSAAGSASTGSGRTYQIDQSASQVRFELDEDLRGLRNTVVGSTDQIAGEILLDLNQPAAAQLGTIRINARALATDNTLRNRAIQNRILNTDAFEFISFAPTAINGLPDSVAVGDTVSFSLAGELTIRDLTQPAVFDVTVTVESPEKLSGSASSLVSRSDFDLRIPEVPNVANVEEDVELHIDFVANAS